MSRKTCVDLFAGIGGFAVGASRAGLGVLASTDSGAPQCETLRLNFDHRVVEGDAWEMIDEVAGLGADVLLGGPPCKSFSPAGGRDPCDRRGDLVQCFLDHVAAARPAAFVIENVPGIMSSEKPRLDLSDAEAAIVEELGQDYAAAHERHMSARHSGDGAARRAANARKREIKKKMEQYLEPVPDQIRARAEQAGYRVESKELVAADYGTPQVRSRVFFAGVDPSRAAFSWPAPTHGQVVTTDQAVHAGRRDWVSSAEAIRHLRAMSGSEVPNHDRTNHRASTVEKFSRVEPGESPANFGSAYRRLVPDYPAWTIMDNHGSTFLHYCEDRVITVREALVLQGFPACPAPASNPGWDAWHALAGTKGEQYLQAGNALPPQLAQAVVSGIRFKGPG